MSRYFIVLHTPEEMTSMQPKPVDKAVSSELSETIYELQSLTSLKDFALAGGTSLAIRYNHRQSIDIDLFSPNLVGVNGMELIKKEIEDYYSKEKVANVLLENEENGEQYCFLKSLIRKGETTIKIEVIQNVPLLDPFESICGIRMVTVKDISLLKLMSLCSRNARKDVYDLDILTDIAIPLPDLMKILKEKEQKYSTPEQEWLFDLDERQTPTKNPMLLLEFDNIDYKEIPSRPNHSTDVLLIIPPNKTYTIAKLSWRRKVRNLLRSMGIQPPPISPIN